MLGDKAIKYLQRAFIAIFLILFINILYISLSGYHFISGANIKKYGEERGTKTINVNAKRGTIYDRNGEVIAKDSYTYTIVAHLDNTRYDQINDRPAYVTNPSEYAKKLAPILKASESELLKNLSKPSTKNAQTYLGVKAKGLSISQKEEIEKLNLNGIEFEEVVSRYYPNGVFASSTIGYATYDEKEKRMVGKLGVEATYDTELKGEDGSRTVQVDQSGFIKKELSTKKSTNGDDVYLTIDNNIQRIVESNLEEMFQNNKADIALAVVTNAKTNEVLAVSNRPTFNPNLLNIKDFTNPFVSMQFEPGSTMKTFTYASAMDAGVYKGSDKYYSGPVNIVDNGVVVQTIKNYENYNWGSITYDEGYMRSSNTGIIALFKNQLDTNTYEKYLDLFKFFKKTGIEIAGESSGKKQMEIKQEKYTTGFGQSSSITPVQLLQAFSSITNKGKMMKPYITKEIKKDNGEVVKSFSPIQVGTPIKETTANNMLKLMTRVVEDAKGTGYNHYRIQDYTIAGKTGTAEYIENGRYLTCQTCYYTSFLMTAPASNPEIIVYLVTKHDASPSYAARGKFIKNVTSNVLAYLNVKPDKKKASVNKEVKTYEIESFINKSVEYARKKLASNATKYVILGNGNKIVNQSPLPYTLVSNEQRVFLLTNDTKFKMIDLSNFSKSDVLKYASLLNIKVEFKGNGYVKKQNIVANKILNAKDVLVVTLE